MTPTATVDPGRLSRQSADGTKLEGSQWYSIFAMVTRSSTFVVPVSPGQLDRPPMVVKMGVP